MKKNTRARITNPEPRKRRELRLSRETVRVLSPTELVRAAGGSGCDTTSFSTVHTHTDGGAGVAAVRR
jgi:hypothetical protein